MNENMQEINAKARNMCIYTYTHTYIYINTYRCVQIARLCGAIQSDVSNMVEMNESMQESNGKARNTAEVAKSYSSEVCVRVCVHIRMYLQC